MSVAFVTLCKRFFDAGVFETGKIEAVKEIRSLVRRDQMALVQITIVPDDDSGSLSVWDYENQEVPEAGTLPAASSWDCTVRLPQWYEQSFRQQYWMRMSRG